ncbi:hypothetical protein PsYK624_037510 [Phanerochaete sordida]|uniref:Uncharacterized protein n=1 Tax=Phanerochaete sordida TaxID=48140 RepID=A0A9P3G3N3_9APHY|nr:hypothetical protein PsYK624_037510 [Phanerochaete sordida]
MSTAPAPSVTRGEILLQPSYFTSSLFVDPLREDIAQLVQVFAQAFLLPKQRSQPDVAQPDDDIVMGPVVDALRPRESQPTTSVDPVSKPFAFFKMLWRDFGWSWFHFKVLDGRAREVFIRVVLRCFSEYFIEDVNPLAQTVALFGMYTFFMTQPTDSTPPLHAVKHIPLPLDTYNTLLELPTHLVEPHLHPLQPYAAHLLQTLLSAQAFHILPKSSLRAQNPSDIPRERFVEDTAETPTEATAKKKGRPSRRDKARKAKDAVAALDRWLDKSTYTYPETAHGVGEGSAHDPPKTTHTLISHPPAASRAIYSMEKSSLLNVIDPPGSALQIVAAGPDASASRQPVPGVDPIDAGARQGGGDPREREALARANDAVLARLKKIDEMAAERGLEVGGEGGEKTGLARVERAVREFQGGKGGSRGGILSLLEGAGLEGAGGQREAG